MRFVIKGTRINPIGTKSVRALDRYLRVTAGHRDADARGLWLGRSGVLTSFGVRKRSSAAPSGPGSAAYIPHQLRYSAAHHLRVAGEHALKGVPDPRQLYRVVESVIV